MKKNLQKFLTMSILMLIPINIAKAECSYANQNQQKTEANNIKYKYEMKTKDAGTTIVDGDEIEITLDYFEINILNLTEDLYVEAKNLTTKEIKTYYHRDIVDNKISIISEDMQKVYEYEFKVKPVDSTCTDDAYRISTLTLPMKNFNATFDVCRDAPEFYLCKEFVKKEVSVEEFFDEYEIYKKEKEEDKKDEKTNIENTVIEFIKEYKYPIIITSTLIIAIGVASYVIIRKRRVL